MPARSPHPSADEPSANALTALRSLQTSVGNAAVARLVSVQRSWIPGALRTDEGTPQQIADAIRHDNPGDVKAINDFSHANPSQKLQLV
jgi:hypothetical protein